MKGDDNAFPAGDRLDSWKEIAAYLRKGVRTIQRWEQSDGLPVRRLGSDKSGPVFAYKSELDAWLAQSSGSVSSGTGQGEVRPEPIPDRRSTVIAGLLIVTVIGASVALVVRSRDSLPAPLHPVPVTTDHGWELEPAISPDGRQVAYVWTPEQGKAFVYLRTVGTDSSSRLTAGTDVERSPAWSPDGRSLAFARQWTSGPGRTLVVTSSSGGLETQVGDLSGAGRLVWSPDGRWLVTTEGTEGHSAIVAILVATGEKRKLTEPFPFAPCGFGIPPGSSRLIVCRGGPGPASVIQVGLGPDLKPDGSVTVLIPSKWMREMILTADGKEMIYTEGTAEERIGLWRQRLWAGAEPELLYESQHRCTMPSISADARRIVFAASTSFRESTWTLPLDNPSAGATPLLSSTHSDLNPDYSPDGHHIAFHSTRTAASEIWIADQDGKNAHRLTSTNAHTTATPRWSPDGSWIVYESTQLGQSEIFLIRSSGGVPQRLTDHKATDAIPNWSRDGKSIYFCSDRSGRFEIWQMPAFGGTPKQITDEGGFAAYESPDGMYLYYSQNRNTGPVWRLRKTDGHRERIIPQLHGIFFAPAFDGVYFHRRRSIYQWNANTGQTTEVFTPPKPMGIGMALSPDGKNLLFTQIESQETDLYLIDRPR